MDSSLAARSVSLTADVLLRFRADRTSFELPLSFQFGMVQAACIAQCPRSIGSAAPFRRVNSAATVASVRAGRTLSTCEFNVFPSYN
jgi:hypothetical protein